MQIYNDSRPRWLGAGAGPVHTAQTGVFAATRIATNDGWKATNDINVGDLVLTYDAGMLPVCGVNVHSLDPALTGVNPCDWPLFIPAGALGNLADFIVMPGQAALVESSLAADLLGQATVFIRAADLDSVAGVFRVSPTEEVDVAVLQFVQPQVIFGAGGALFGCAGLGDEPGIFSRSDQAKYPVLTASEADLVLSHEIAPAGAGITQAAGHPTA